MFAQALDTPGRADEVLFGHEADSVARAELAAYGARDDVDLVESRAGNSEVAILGLCLAQNIWARAAPVNKL